jgi:hypothetical protein
MVRESGRIGFARVDTNRRRGLPAAGRDTALEMKLHLEILEPGVRGSV